MDYRGEVIRELYEPEKWGLHICLVSRWERKNKEENIQVTDKVLSNKIGKFPTPDYTLTNISRQMWIYCVILLNKNFPFNIQRIFIIQWKFWGKMPKKLKKHSLSNNSKCSINVWKDFHHVRNEGSAILSKGYIFGWSN